MFSISTSFGFQRMHQGCKPPTLADVVSNSLSQRSSSRKERTRAGRWNNHIGQETRRMKAMISRSAIIASVLLAGLIVFSATPSIADSSLSKLQTKQNPAEAIGKIAPAEVISDAASATRSRTVEDAKPLLAASPYVATAYSLKGRTASGRMVSRGLIAADPAVLPARGQPADARAFR